MSDDRKEDLEAELAGLEAELAECRAALPAHSIRPSQLQEIEELEDRIKALRRRLAENS